MTAYFIVCAVCNAFGIVAWSAEEKPLLALFCVLGLAASISGVMGVLS